jgi:hypothetical protein
VFYPKDSYSHPVQLDLLFRQVSSLFPFGLSVFREAMAHRLASCLHIFLCILGFGVLEVVLQIPHFHE